MRHIMTKHIYSFGRYLAVALILLAIFVQVARLLTPYVDTLRPTIENFLERQLGYTVIIGEIDARWYGLRPHIIVHNVTVKDDTDNTLLMVDGADLTLDILGSLTNLQWVWRNIDFSTVYFRVDQDAAGYWSILGLPLSAENGSSWELQSPLLIFDITPQVHFKHVTSELYFANGDVMPLVVPDIIIENAKGFHRLTADVEVEEKKIASVVMERQIASNNISAYSQGFITLHQFPLHAVLKSMLSKEELLHFDTTNHSVKLDGSFWVDLNDQESIGFYGEIFSHKIPLSAYVNENKLPDVALSAIIQGDIDYKGDVSVGLQQVTLNGNPVINQLLYRYNNNMATVWVDEISLQPSASIVSSVVTDVDRLAKFNKVLTRMSPRGYLKNIVVDIDHHDWTQSLLSADVSNISVGAYDNIPSMYGINGHLQTQIHSGYINITSDNAAIFPQATYDRPIILGAVDGQLSWEFEPENNNIHIKSNRFSATSDYGQAYGYFYLNAPWIADSRKSDFTLHVGLQDSGSEHYQQFLPNKVSKNLRHWINHSVRTAKVSDAGFIYRGQFSGAENLRNIQLFLNVNDGVIEYSPQWPVLEEVQAQIIIDNRSVEGVLSHVQTLDALLNDVSITWPVNQQGDINVALSNEIELPVALRFFNETWLAEKTGGTFKRWSGSGRLQLDVNVNIPVFASEDKHHVPQQTFQIGFLNNSIAIGDSALVFDGVAGELSFSQKEGFFANNINFNLFGDNVSLNASTIVKEDDQFLLLTGQGAVDVDVVSQSFLQEPLPIVSGKTEYDFSMRLLLSGNNKRYMPKLDITSDLSGVTIDAPRPFFKQASTERPLNLTVDFKETETQYFFALGKSMLAQIKQRDTGVSGSLSVNRPSVAKGHLPDGDFFVGADFTDIDIEPWLQLFKKYPVSASPNDTFPFNIIYDVRAKNVVVQNAVLNDVLVSGKYQGQLWHANIKSPLVSGNVSVDKTTAQTIKVVLDYLNIPERDKQAELAGNTVDPLAYIDFSFFRSASVLINQLVYKDSPLGRWQFQLNPLKNGVELSNIVSNLSEFELSALNGESGAVLRWYRKLDTSGNDSLHTDVKGRFQGGGIQQLLQSLGYSSVIKSEKTAFDIDVSWSGSPAFFAMERLSGDIKLAMEEGLFLQNNEAASTDILRLFGLFNVDTWLRRLRLNFSDLYKKGVTFDELSVRFLFDQGWVYFQEPLYVKSPSSDFTMSGKLYYPDETIDAVLVTTLPTGENLTFAAAVAGGLPTAIGVYIASKLFKKQVDKFSSLTYSVQGSWSNPEVKFVKVFDNKIDDENVPAAQSSDN